MFHNDPTYDWARVSMHPEKFKQFVTSYITRQNYTFDDLIKHCTFKQLQAAEVELARLVGLHNLEGANPYHSRYVTVKSAALHLNATQYQRMMADMKTMSVEGFSAKYDEEDMTRMEDMLNRLQAQLKS